MPPEMARTFSVVKLYDTIRLQSHGWGRPRKIPGSNTESYPAFAHIGLRENPRKNLNQDLHGVIRKTADFLGKSLNEEQVNQLAEHLSFRSMKSNPATNLEIFAELERKRHGLPEQPDLKFIRQGECGGWRKEMTQEMADKLDAWTKQRLEGTGYNLSSFNKISDGKGHTVGQLEGRDREHLKQRSSAQSTLGKRLLSAENTVRHGALVAASGYALYLFLLHDGAYGTASLTLCTFQRVLTTTDLKPRSHLSSNLNSSRSSDIFKLFCFQVR
ncbi:hypothetical protein ANN_01491 [Periplaneta americana]|uniref:Sulfotransferase domain-containing protein n=1 Tax=Periplaneta americana TaxID=6978 RepID=A0ABQ8TTQ4_PERAM|nr:hypothetical protein ANN_01491 [Periplaneta americana]